jgi:phosphoenolpyruvate synthase/pyruvate phosphate dikinase
MAKLRFVRGYEVHGVSPLPHYFEEIFGHLTGIPSIGPRGDANYFWYSKKGNGAAYYEVKEQAKSAQSTYEYFSQPDNRKSYFKGVQATIAEIQKRIRFVESLNAEQLRVDQLFEYNLQTWMLDAKIFSYYLISQPYRMQLFEDEVRRELKKRVAGSRIDLYLAKLTASEKMTQSSSEELAWAQLLLDAKKQANSITFTQLESSHALLHGRILEHYEKYKNLGLGDGHWTFDSQAEVTRFIEDFKQPKAVLEQKIHKIKSFPQEVLATRQQLAKELYIDQRTVATIEFLAEVSHVRYTMRTEGFIPLIYASIQVIDELARRLGFTEEGDLPYMTFEELMESQAAERAVVPIEELKRRRGSDDEFMILLKDGKVLYLYGKEAGDLFRKLVPAVDHSSTVEVHGVSAEQGRVESTVTVYQWGDSMEATITTMAKHPILVAGQTRPAMMPIIRLAKGIVTDEGGVTSHAAIVARELKIPAVINTHNATKIFKTGDNVILDADAGVVRKLS